jgi:LysM repeat protein
VYRRRRAVALLALATVAALTVVTFRLALVGSGGGALTTAGSTGAALPGLLSGQTYVVQPGDSLWSIVQRSGYHGDPRPVVDALALQLNNSPLLPGQRLRIP